MTTNTTKVTMPLMILKSNYPNFSFGNIWNHDESRFSQEQWNGDW